MQACVAFALILVLTLCVRSNAQTIVGPTEVSASPVLKIVKDGCIAFVDVGHPSYFTSGDRVLIHQAKGASLEYTPTDEGIPTTLGTCGNFEFGTVSEVVGSTVHLSTALVRAYDIDGYVQLVNVISGSRLIIDGPVTCKRWDGKSGGIIAIESRDSVLLRSSLSVSGIGFKGGSVSSAYNSCGTSTKMSVPYPSNFYGQKGEGVVHVDVSRMSGRARTGNGGGGGANHNAGGGGGGNSGDGGTGGAVYDVCGVETNGGLGGVSLLQIASDPRLFFGGGGGGGHENENYGSSGGNGGGIVVISTPVLEIDGSSRSVIATGVTTPNTTHDGAGGGGAGGTVLLNCDQIIGALAIDVSGGTGGSLNTNVLGPHGPGGGGGGGYVLTTQSDLSGTINVTTRGGANGVNMRYSSGIKRDWYTLPGEKGSVVAKCIMPKAMGTSPRPLNQMIFRGTAHQEGAIVVLTDSVQYSAGAAWVRGKVKVIPEFDTHFSFKLSHGSDHEQFDGGSVGADGVVLVMQNLSIAPLGLPGQGLGYENTPHGLAIEFDSYRNAAFADPSGSHVAVQLGDGNKLNPFHTDPYLKAITSDNVPSFVADGSTYYARVVYTSGILSVYIGTTDSLTNPVITLPIDISKELKLGSTETVYMGFTSATGFAVERHEITSWSMSGCGAVVSSIDDNPMPQAPFTIQPSPARDVARLVLGEGVSDGVVQIVDVHGAALWMQPFTNNGTEIVLPAQQLSSGTYAVRVITERESWTQMWSVVR